MVYEVKTPFKTNIVKKTIAVGSVVPRKEIDIKPQVSGIIDKLYVKPGQYVKNDIFHTHFQTWPLSNYIICYLD